ncbi:MAG: hypothetical protein P4N59_02555 [Negativicutes bacterium]|nr:hypothetical protein [Negativicutes bacterium]
MDTRVRLLRDFYNQMQQGKLKLEINHHGFDFLEKLLSDGITLEYGQLSIYDLSHKYKLINVPEDSVNHLLQAHINKDCNVCLYFNETANNTFCFNLDNNYKNNNTALIPEMQFSIRALTDFFEELGVEPLTVASGRGYHVWCRVAEAIENRRLSDFMMRMVAKSMAALHENGYDYHKIKFNMYPNYKNNNVLSLRLFGSEHIKNKVFSYVHTKAGLLDEEQSWDYFADYLANKTIPRDNFTQAHKKLAAQFTARN